MLIGSRQYTVLFPLKYWIELNLIFTSVAILGIRNSDNLYLPYIHGWNSLNIIFEQFTLWIDHFMTKQTDTMSEDWPFHDKTYWCYVWGWPFHDKTHWCHVWDLTISWQNRRYYVWELTISWHNTLIPCLGLDYFMTKQTVLCLGIDYFITKHTDSMSGAFMCNGQITTRTHDSMINTHAHSHFEFYVRF
jgi:hypothetical protein